MNSKNADLDEDKLVDNVENAILKEDLSPDQAQSLNTKHRRNHKKNKKISARTMHTRSHILQSLSK